MTDWHGSLRKMTTELADPVRYTVLPDEGGPCLNDLLGKMISIRFSGAIHCVACDRLTKKSRKHKPVSTTNKNVAGAR